MSETPNTNKKFSMFYFTVLMAGLIVEVSIGIYVISVFISVISLVE